MNPRRAARTDANQAAIVAALRDAGATVFCTNNVGDGFPDLVVGYRGRNYLLEVKSDRGRLTPSQEKLHTTWQGTIQVVKTPQEALNVIT